MDGSDGARCSAAGADPCPGGTVRTARFMQPWIQAGADFKPCGLGEAPAAEHRARAADTVRLHVDHVISPPSTSPAPTQRFGRMRLACLQKCLSMQQRLCHRWCPPACPKPANRMSASTRRNCGAWLGQQTSFQRSGRLWKRDENNRCIERARHYSGAAKAPF